MKFITLICSTFLTLPLLSFTPISFEDYLEDADFIAFGQVTFAEGNLVAIVESGGGLDSHAGFYLRGLFEYWGHHPEFSKRQYKGGPHGGFHIIARMSDAEEYKEIGMTVWKLSWNSIFHAYEVRPAAVNIYSELKAFLESSEKWKRETDPKIEPGDAENGGKPVGDERAP